ncbi:MAG: RluA family pseudouridine synthase [Clostridiales bacterium]|nr:RluA family pseudouridine synthase [Clostridiales bacterium]
MNMSRHMIKKIRLYGQLLVNGTASRMKDPVYAGDNIEAHYDKESNAARRQHCTISVYFEDDWLFVCEKPAGLVTHPSWQHMDDSLIQRLSDDRLHPVMRLDRETSGVIIIAKNGYSHNQIISETMEKEYIGIVHGRFEPSSGIINLPIGRSDSSIITRVVRDDGKKSITGYQTLLTNDVTNVSMVRFVLKTGRCHQIRVHSAHLGHPLVGDGLYGLCSMDSKSADRFHLRNESLIDRQALHAAYLSFIHPITREKMVFKSPLPVDMENLIAHSEA